MKEAFKQLWPSAEPGSPLSPLPPGLAERGLPHQGLACVRPAIRLRLPLVVFFQIRSQPLFKLLYRAEIATPQKLPGQHAEEQLHLVQPRPMTRHIVEHVPLFASAEERASLLLRLQLLGLERHAVEVSHHLAQLQAHVRVQVVHHPVELLHVGVVSRHTQHMSPEVQVGPRRPQIPDHLTGRHTKRGDQRPRPQADILKLAFLRLARLGRQGRCRPIQHLHPGLLIAAQHQPPLPVETRCIDIQLTHLLGFGLEVGVVAVEPVDALVRLEVAAVEDAPDRGPTDGLGVSLVDDGGGDLVESPAIDGSVVLSGLAGGGGHDGDARLGGKSSGACRSAARPEVRPGHAGRSVRAIARRCGGHSPKGWRYPGWRGCRLGRRAGRCGSGRRETGGWNAPERGLPVGCGVHRPVRWRSRKDAAWLLSPKRYRAWWAGGYHGPSLPSRLDYWRRTYETVI